MGPSSDESSRLVKVLCPHNIVGSLIGKNGITVNAMIDSSGAKIRFSQASEHYPGTTDRTVLIVGDEVCVLNALQDVTTRMCEVSSQTVCHFYFQPYTASNTYALANHSSYFSFPSCFVVASLHHPCATNTVHSSCRQLMAPLRIPHFYPLLSFYRTSSKLQL